MLTVWAGSYTWPSSKTNGTLLSVAGSAYNPRPFCWCQWKRMWFSKRGVKRKSPPIKKQSQMPSPGRIQFNSRGYTIFKPGEYFPEKAFKGWYPYACVSELRWWWSNVTESLPPSKPWEPDGAGCCPVSRWFRFTVLRYLNQDLRQIWWEVRELDMKMSLMTKAVLRPTTTKQKFIGIEFNQSVNQVLCIDGFIIHSFSGPYIVLKWESWLSNDYCF